MFYKNYSSIYNSTQWKTIFLSCPVLNCQKQNIRVEIVSKSQKIKERKHRENANRSSKFHEASGLNYL